MTSIKQFLYRMKDLKMWHFEHGMLTRNLFIYFFKKGSHKHKTGATGKFIEELLHFYRTMLC